MVVRKETQQTGVKVNQPAQRNVPHGIRALSAILAMVMTGILGEVVDSIATIDYWFTGTSQRVHKLVHHFALRQIGGELTVEGDPDHEAEDAIWVDFADLDDVLSYPNERKIAWLYARKLNRQA